MKKISILLILCIISFNSLFSQADVYDGSREPWTKGSGTAEDPFQIENARQLAFFQYFVAVAMKTEGLHFLLTTDIDLNGREDFPWTPVGLWQYKYEEGEGCASGGTVPVAFCGHFDGGNHIIKNLYVNNEIYGVFFAETNGATVKNLIIDENSVIKANLAGGICVISASSSIMACVNKATIIGIPGFFQVVAGGIVGQATGTAVISECCNFGNITAQGCAGGICGRSGVAIKNCYNRGNVSSTIYSNNSSSAGGIVGENISTTANCYNTGTISTLSGEYQGGISGKATKIASNCYFLNTCGGSDQFGGTSLTNEQMLDPALVTMLNDNTDVWDQDTEPFSNDGYPILNGIMIGIPENGNIENALFSLYPNPANNMVSIKGLSMQTVRIYNVSGVLIYETASHASGILSIDVSKWSEGIYFVHVDTKSKTCTRKFLIAK